MSTYRLLTTSLSKHQNNIQPLSKRFSTAQYISILIVLALMDFHYETNTKA